MAHATNSHSSSVHAENTSSRRSASYAKLHMFHRLLRAPIHHLIVHAGVAQPLQRTKCVARRTSYHQFRLQNIYQQLSLLSHLGYATPLRHPLRFPTSVAKGGEYNSATSFTSHAPVCSMSDLFSSTGSLVSNLAFRVLTPYATDRAPTLFSHILTKPCLAASHPSQPPMYPHFANSKSFRMYIPQANAGKTHSCILYLERPGHCFDSHPLLHSPRSSVEVSSAPSSAPRCWAQYPTSAQPSGAQEFCSISPRSSHCTDGQPPCKASGSSCRCLHHLPDRNNPG